MFSFSQDLTPHPIQEENLSLMIKNLYRLIYIINFFYFPELAKGSERVPLGVRQIGGEAPHPHARGTHTYADLVLPVTAHTCQPCAIPSSQRNLTEESQPSDCGGIKLQFSNLLSITSFL